MFEFMKGKWRERLNFVVQEAQEAQREKCSVLDARNVQIIRINNVLTALMICGLI